MRSVLRKSLEYFDVAVYCFIHQNPTIFKIYKRKLSSVSLPLIIYAEFQRSLDYLLLVQLVSDRLGVEDYSTCNLSEKETFNFSVGFLCLSFDF